MPDMRSDRGWRGETLFLPVKIYFQYKYNIYRPKMEGAGSTREVSTGPLNACMEPSNGSPLFHTNFWLEPSNFHPDFDLRHCEHCLNLAIFTPIGLVLSKVF